MKNDKSVIQDKLLSNPSKLATEILESKEPSEYIRTLWDIINKSDNKKLKKSAKKVFYILKSRGINPDSFRTEEKQEKKDSTTTTNIQFYRSLLFIPDSFFNSRVITTYYRENTGNYELLDIIYNFEEGIKKIQSGKISKKGIERIRESEKESVEIPSDFALYRLKTVVENTKTDNKLPDIIRSHILEAKTAIHPVLKIYPTVLSNIVSSEEINRLFTRPEIQRFIIPENELTNYKKEIDNAKKNILIINNKTPEEKIKDTVSRFISNYFNRKRLYMFRELLLDISLYLNKLEEKTLSKWLIMYAENLINPKTNISEHPLIQFLIYKHLLVNGLRP